ncbi:extracellular solute-binding protein [Gracilibacillus boraciitolerans]|nr:extracellular solute-binding protein [Gracilibacillus boraciitolerans]
MKKFVWFLLVSTLLVLLISACSNDDNEQDVQESQGENTDTNEGVIEIDFWSATNPTQDAFWKKVAEEFNAEQDNIQVNVSQMRETPTSEATIQSAIAGGEAPVFSENISRGFAAQLAKSEALVSLNTLEGWEELLESRKMSETVKPWRFSDDNQYVLPIYSNPMLFGWRVDILNELGFEEMPQTYSEVLEVADALKQEKSDTFFWAKSDLADPTAWMRWFDFFMLYNAASEGNNFIEGNEFVADDKAGQQVLDLMYQLQERDALLVREASDPFETGLGIFTDIGPWTFAYWEEQFPEMKYGETFDLALPPVPDNADTEEINTFADTKGVVIYASATEEEQQAAVDFLTWVYSDPDRDLQWFEQTDLPPARDDLTTNESFQDFLDENPALVPYAEAVPYAVPPIDNPNFNELQTLIGQEAFNPVVGGAKEPEEAWNDMKQAIEGGELE